MHRRFYKIKLFLGAVFLLFVYKYPLSAQIEVPVNYCLASGAPTIEGFLTGGSWCEPEGLSVTKSGASVPILLNYEDIDQIENLHIAASQTLFMHVRLKDENEFDAEASIPIGLPILVLRDEPPQSQENTAGKVRTFTHENFKGIPLIEFEAAIQVEATPEALKEMAEELAEAAQKQDLNKAIAIYNQIGDILEALTASSSEDQD